tara:strand:- start:557 stop:1051 length:495 start_codon:yes stop_codon:yes gene_type:complete
MPKCQSTEPDMSVYSDLDKAYAKVSNQKGGNLGYHLDINAEPIGGQAPVQGYQVEPELRDGQFVESAVDKICDTSAMTGGRRRYKKSKKSKKNKKTKRTKKTKRNLKNKKAKKTKKSKKNKRRKLKGGNAPYDEAFSGSESVYFPQMNGREFGCQQPNWEPKCA